MKDKIEIDGVKYKRIEEDEEEILIKGQYGAVVVFIISLVLFIYCLFTFQWVEAILSFLITLTCGYIGFDGLSYLNKKIDKFSGIKR